MSVCMYYVSHLHFILEVKCCHMHGGGTKMNRTKVLWMLCTAEFNVEIDNQW